MFFTILEMVAMIVISYAVPIGILICLILIIRELRKNK